MSANLPQQWLERANEDLAVAQLVFEEEYFAHVCFLAQQSIEKALKGYLLQHTGTYPKTHRLLELLASCAAIDATFAQLLPNCTVVDQYYTSTRYPDALIGGGPDGPPSHSEADEAMKLASDLLTFVQARL
jgi:HEPN domain-containing protein